MDIQKIILYLHILGICFTFTLTYIMGANLILHVPIKPVSIVILAFGWAYTIKLNPVFHQLWNKWFSRD